MGGNSHSAMGNSFNLELVKEAWQINFCMVMLKEEVGNEMFGTLWNMSITCSNFGKTTRS